MDSIYFHTTYKGHGAKAQIKEISVIRSGEGGNVIASHTELLLHPTSNEPETDPIKALGNIRDKMLQPSFAKHYYVVIFHDVHKQLLLALESQIALGEGNIPDRLFADRMWVDLTQVTWPLVASRQLTDRSLKGLIEHFKIEGYTGCNSAQEDVSYLLRVYIAAMKRIAGGLKMEEAARDIGGEKFDMLRSFLGF